jgi:hypothetical protein
MAAAMRCHAPDGDCSTSVVEAALNEESETAAWKTIPSWFFFGDQDRNIRSPCVA